MDCFYYLFNNTKNKTDLNEPLILQEEFITVNCLYIKSNIENNIYNIDIFKKKIGKNVPKFLPIEFSDGTLEFLICIDAMVDIKKLCDDCYYSYVFIRTIEINKKYYNNLHIIIYDSLSQKFRLQKIIN